LHAIADDPAFHDLAHDGGYAVGWRDGNAWTAEAEAERTELARLWMTEPWLQEGSD
jgi:hypothetical protein